MMPFAPLLTAMFTSSSTSSGVGTRPRVEIFWSEHSMKANWGLLLDQALKRSMALAMKLVG